MFLSIQASSATICKGHAQEILLNTQSQQYQIKSVMEKSFSIENLAITTHTVLKDEIKQTNHLQKSGWGAMAKPTALRMIGVFKSNRNE